MRRCVNAGRCPKGVDWAGGGTQEERQVEGDPLSNILHLQGRDLDDFFCLAFQRIPLPGSKHTVVLFTAHLSRPLQVNSILAYLSHLGVPPHLGVQQSHLQQPHAQPNLPRHPNGLRLTRLAKEPLSQWVTHREQHVLSLPCEHTSATARCPNVLHCSTSSLDDHCHPKPCHPSCKTSCTDMIIPVHMHKACGSAMAVVWAGLPTSTIQRLGR